ncbi:MAG: hypothetical protein RLZZ08_1669 [Pseudomonadota bacterium]
MSDHPSTFRGGSTDSSTLDWHDRASIHLKNVGEGILHGMGALHRGSLAEMVAMVAAMPPERREEVVIEKAGDHRLDTAEILDLSRRADFPR